MEILATLESLPRLREKCANSKEIGLDYETTSFHPHPKAPLHHDKLEVVGFGLGFPDGEKTYLPVAHMIGENLPYQECFDLLRNILKDKEKYIYSHNAKFESTVTNSLRIKHQCNWRDGMIAAWMVDAKITGGGGFKLKPQVKKYLRYEMETWEGVAGNYRAHQVAPTRMAPYCSDDALYGMKLCQYHMEELKKYDMMKAFDRLENPIAVEVIPHMEECGMGVDSETLRELHASHSEKMKELNQEFLELTGVDIGSNLQISRRMFDELKWWKPLKSQKRGKSGYYSVGKPIREVIAEHLDRGSNGWKAMELKNRYQTISKLVSTYTLTLIDNAKQYKDRRMRTSWNQTRTDTGRFSSTDPALQTLPIRTPEGKEIRKAIVPNEGWILYDRDYSGADLRMMAHLSQDERMIARFFEEDDNLHRLTAKELNCEYHEGKTINLGLIYEMSAYTLANRLGISEHEAEDFYFGWHQTYPGVRRYHRAIHNYAAKHGFVRTITGRIRKIDGIHSRDIKTRKKAERLASNTPDQGSVADMVKIAMRNLIREWKDRGVLYDYYTGEGKAKLVAQVHDELLVELREDFAEEGAEDTRRHMETAIKLRVPCKTDGGFGKDWLEAH